MEIKSMMKTSFSDKIVENITCDDDKEYIFQKMKIISGLKYDDKYAKLFNPKYLNNLSNPHIFCIKSSGNPYLLFLIKINDVNYTFLIDKKVKKGYKYPGIYLMNNCFTDDLYSGTLFETELIRHYDNSWSLLICDIYTYKGKKCNETIIDRMNIVSNMLENDYDKDRNDLCKVEIKRYFDYKDINYVLDVFSKKLPYNIRGLYFIPIKPTYSKMLILIDNNNKRLEKMEELLTIKTNKPEIYEIYKKENDSNVPIGYAYIPNIKVSHKMEELFENKKENMLKYKYNKSFQRWEPNIKFD